MKKCSKCNMEKPLSEFYKDKYTKDTYCCHCKECRKQYQQTHRKQCVKYVLKNRESKQGKEVHRKAQHKYSKTSKGRLTQLRWKNSIKCKLGYKKHTNKRRRNLGFNILIQSDWSEPVDWHHVNDNDVVPVPRYLHEMCFTGEQIEHRKLCNKLINILYESELKI